MFASGNLYDWVPEIKQELKQTKSVTCTDISTTSLPKVFQVKTLQDRLKHVMQM